MRDQTGDKIAPADLSFSDSVRTSTVPDDKHETPALSEPRGQTESQRPEQSHLHGLKLYLLITLLYLGIYLVALELTMLGTLVPMMTDQFGNVTNISWYSSAYVLSLCVFTPVGGKLYSQLPVKLVYLSSIGTFNIGVLISSLATSSPMFIAGRVINGIGAAGQFGGALLLIGPSCRPEIRPLVTAGAFSIVPVGSMTGPIIAGVLAARAGWRWCFWMLLFLGGFIIVCASLMKLPEKGSKPSIRQGLKALPRKIDLVGFVLFASAAVMLLLALTWGGQATISWSSPTIIGLLCGGGGATQAIPFFLPLWFQAIKGDSTEESAIHILPSLISMVVATMTCGSLVRKLRYISPWAIIGGLITSIGSGLLTTLTPDTSIGKWIGYQIITSFGRGLAFQIPITAVQEFVPPAKHAISITSMNLFMQLGNAVSVSSSQTIFNNRLPSLLSRYAPEVNTTMVLQAGATRARSLIPPDQLPGFLKAYNQAITSIFVSGQMINTLPQTQSFTNLISSI
ncbi:putative Major facilitator superfamily (MFS) profile domain-containing protein [Seiridium cardinale]|uniref:Major facilitator superfamily (MFS) profile domain-containing protein n=1 Tax=Seiridium cardinale TaxID=138064 RepID=A0ABR2XXF5_9PEZI